MLSITAQKKNNILYGQVGAPLAKHDFYTSHFMSVLTRPTHIMVIGTPLLNRPQRVELVQSIPT
jgi:hypothetical protein